MDKINLGIYILGGIALVGLIVLMAMDKSVEVMTPILTAILGIIAGKNGNSIVGAVKMAFGMKDTPKKGA